MRGITSVLWRVFSTVEGWLQYCGGMASVLWGDNNSTVEGGFSTVGRGITVVHVGVASVLWRLFSTVGHNISTVGVNISNVEGIQYKRLFCRNC